VPHIGKYREVLNTDSQHYGGSNVGNLASVEAQPIPYAGFPASVQINLPPLAVVIFTKAG
jgi:1,4-alpha-glucan branching enzyme